jgi:hypothetical protein
LNSEKLIILGKATFHCSYDVLAASIFGRTFRPDDRDQRRAGSDIRVDEIEPDRGVPEPHLARSRLINADLLPDQHLRPAGLGETNRMYHEVFFREWVYLRLATPTSPIWVFANLNPSSVPTCCLSVKDGESVGMLLAGTGLHPLMTL